VSTDSWEVQVDTPSVFGDDDADAKRAASEAPDMAIASATAATSVMIFVTCCLPANVLAFTLPFVCCAGTPISRQIKFVGNCCDAAPAWKMARERLARGTIAGVLPGRDSAAHSEVNAAG
jgi:hypothetical protein